MPAIASSFIIVIAARGNQLEHKQEQAEGHGNGEKCGNWAS